MPGVLLVFSTSWLLDQFELHLAEVLMRYLLLLLLLGGVPLLGYFLRMCRAMVGESNRLLMLLEERGSSVLQILNILQLVKVD